MKSKFFALSILCCLQFFPATAHSQDLERELIDAAANDDLEQAIILLDKGADPTILTWKQNYEYGPAMHMAAGVVVKTNQDRVYKEFLKRGVRPNSKARYPGTSLTKDTVWQSLMYLINLGYREQLENFLLRSLKDGANPFEEGPTSPMLATLIFNKLDSVTDTLVEAGVEKTYWLPVTSSWSSLYSNFWSSSCSLPRGDSQRQKLISIFSEYFPVMKAAGVELNEWGYYEVKDNKLELKESIAKSFVNCRNGPIDDEFLQLFINHGFDINKKIGDTSTCESAQVNSITDVDVLLRVGCKMSSTWLYQFLMSRKYDDAKEFLARGGNIDGLFFIQNKLTPALAQMCYNSSLEDRTRVEWLLRNGANVNLHDSNGANCLSQLAWSFRLSKDKEDILILKDLLKYKVNVNYLNPISRDYSALARIAPYSNTLDEAEFNYVYEAIELLLKAGANPNLADKNPTYIDFMPLMVLSSKFGTPNTLKVMNLLLDYGADPALFSDKWASPIHRMSHYCRIKECTPIFERIYAKAPQLLNQKASIWNAMNTPLCHTVEQDNDIAAKFLVSKKADQTILCGWDNKTALEMSKPGSKVRAILEASAPKP